MVENLPMYLAHIISRTRLPYPLFFAVTCSSSYLIGVLLALLSGDLHIFLQEYGFILLGFFGFISGFFTFMLLKMFSESLSGIEEYIVLSGDKWNILKSKIEEKATSKVYWLLFLFWMIYSFYEIFIRGVTWWRRDYNFQLIVDVYGYLFQGFNGCFLGGIFMTLISINLNLAYREIYSRKVFNNSIVTIRGKKKLSKFKKLVILEVFAAAIAAALAISIWSEEFLYTPIIGSLAMILPTAIYPHYIFYRILSRAKEDRIESLEKRIEEIPVGEETTIGDLLLFNKLSKDLENARNVKPWLVDVKMIFQLLGATGASQIITLIIEYLI